MASEAWLYRNRVGPGLGCHGHVLRVENLLESGTPDVNYAIGGVQGWVELKVERDGVIHLEKYQVPWHRRRLRHCGGLGLWFLIMDEEGETLRLVPSRLVVEAPKSFYRKWTVVRVADLPQHHFQRKPIDWALVAEILTKPPVFGEA